MTIFDPAPSIPHFGVDRTSLSTPFADETDHRPILDIDHPFVAWRDLPSVLLAEQIPHPRALGADKPTITGVTPTIISIAASFEDLSGHPTFDAGRVPRFLGNIEVGLHNDINRALQELEEVNTEASENALPIPSSTVHRNARFLIPKIYRTFRRPLSVYPLLDGEIAIEATVASKDSVLVSCEPDGRILCLANIHRRSRHAKYDRVSELPDSFMRSALAELRELAQ